MKKYFICYGDERFKKAKELCCQKAINTHFFDVVRGYSPEDFEPEWKKQNQKILSIKRGNGLWLWKPYFILRTLGTMNCGDFLFYEDSGTFFLRSPKYILQSMGNDDIWVSDIPLAEKQFTKPLLFSLMGCNGKDFLETRQIQGTFLGVRKTPRSLQFIREWLMYCADFACISPEEKTCSHPDYYISHREDQSILSLLCKKYKIIPHQDPSQYSKYDFVYNFKGVQYLPSFHHEYPISILSHRTSNASSKTIFLNYLRIFLPQCIGCFLYPTYIDFVRRKKKSLQNR